MGEPTEILTDQHIEVAIVDGQGDRQAVMLRDPRTKQSVTLMLSDQRTADRGVWLRMRGFVSNRPLRRTSDEIIDYVDTTPPAWDVEVEFETSPVFHHLASVHIHRPEDTEAPHEPDGESWGSAGKRRWQLGAPLISGIVASLSTALAFFSIGAVLGEPLDMTAGGWTDAAIMGVGIMFAAVVVSYAGVLLARMRETSAMADDLASARRHLDKAAEQLTIIRRFRDLKSQTG